jgi:carboxylesterase type B
MRLSYILLLLPVALAAPALEKIAAPTVSISSPQASIVGTSSASVEIFNGIPYALPPTGTLRLKPPQTLTSSLGSITATATALACSQMLSNDLKDIPLGLLGVLDEITLLQTLFSQGITQSEDCLTVNIRRPVGTTASSKLPVVFWIYGGSFALGSTSQYDGTNWVARAIDIGKPVVYVSVNYRTNGFGFLPGKEVLKDGSANLGLLDQRLGLKVCQIPFHCTLHDFVAAIDSE